MNIMGGEKQEAPNGPLTYEHAKSMLRQLYKRVTPAEREALTLIVGQADHRPCVNDAGRCENCGGRPTVNPFTLRAYHVKVLRVLAAAGPGMHRLSELVYELSPPRGNLFTAKEVRTCLSNFCTVAWWGLVTPYTKEGPDGKRRKGWWAITELGKDFLAGRVQVQEKALVYTPGSGPVLQGYEGALVSPASVVDTWQNFEDAVQAMRRPSFVDGGNRADNTNWGEDHRD